MSLVLAGTVAVICLLAGLGVGAAIGWFARRTEPAGEGGSAMDRLGALKKWAEEASACVDRHGKSFDELRTQTPTPTTPEGEAIRDVLQQMASANEDLRERLRESEAKLGQQAESLEKQTQQAFTDSLTQLPNRRALDEEFSRRWTLFKKDGTDFAVGLLDIDHFKRLNDRHGHLVGDAILRHLGETMLAWRDDSTFIGRYGGEEISVVFPTTESHKCGQRFEALRKHLLASQIVVEGKRFRVSVSIGVAIASDACSLEQLIRRSDVALYASKRAGRACVHWHDGEESQRVTPLPTTNASPDTLFARLTSPWLTPSGPKLNESKEDSDREKEPIDTGSKVLNQLRKRMSDWQIGGPAFSILVAQVDGYAKLFAKYGEEVAQKAVRAVIQMARAELRELDRVGTSGKSAFWILAPGFRQKSSLELAESIRKRVDRYSSLDRLGVEGLSVSFGVAEVQASEGVEDLLARAHTACESASRRGGNLVALHDGSSVVTMPTSLVST